MMSGKLLLTVFFVLAMVYTASAQWGWGGYGMYRPWGMGYGMYRPWGMGYGMYRPWGMGYGMGMYRPWGMGYGMYRPFGMWGKK